METLLSPLASRKNLIRNGVSPEGWNIWRHNFVDGEWTFVRAETSLADAWGAARRGDQIQQGLDGAVINVCI